MSVRQEKTTAIRMLNVSTKVQDSDVNASLGTAVMECHAQVKPQYYIS